MKSLILFLVLIAIPISIPKPIYAQTSSIIPNEKAVIEGRIAVLPIVNKLGNQALVSRDEIHVLTTLVQGYVQKQSQGYFQVMTDENIRLLLPPDKRLEDCQGDCEVEYGRELGAHFILTGTLVKFGKKKNGMRLILKMHDTKAATLQGIVTIQALDAEDMENQLESHVTELTETLVAKEKQINVSAQKIETKQKELQEQEQKILLDQHLQKLWRTYEQSVKPLIEEGDEQGKTALYLFLKEYENHPLGNPFAKEAQAFYEEKQKFRKKVKAMFMMEIEGESASVNKAELRKILDQLKVDKQLAFENDTKLGLAKKRILVLQVSNQSHLKSEEINLLTEEIQSKVQLKTKDDYQVMTQENILQILSPNKSLEDLKSEIEKDNGRFIGAYFMIIGSLSASAHEKDNLRLSLRLYAIDNATLMSTTSINGSNVNEIEEKLNQAIDILISEIINK